jgi:hypothetical protein
MSGTVKFESVVEDLKNLDAGTKRIEAKSDPEYIRLASKLLDYKFTERLIDESDVAIEKRTRYAAYKELQDKYGEQIKAVKATQDRLKAEMLRYLEESEERFAALTAQAGWKGERYTPPEVPGLTIYEDWTFEVEDPSLVPDTYKKVDTEAIQKRVKQNGPAFECPGIVVRRRKNFRVSLDVADKATA